MKCLDIGYPYLNLKVIINTHGDVSVALRSIRSHILSYTQEEGAYKHILLLVFIRTIRIFICGTSL